MGVVKGIGYDEFPEQHGTVGKTTDVCFNYDNNYLSGVIVRDDKGAPGVTIIRLGDGRHVLATECMWRYPGND